MAGKEAMRPAPPPRDVNTRLLVAVGTALFVVAWAVLLTVDVAPIWSRTALAGWILGLLGLGVIQFQSRARRPRRSDGTPTS